MARTAGPWILNDRREWSTRVLGAPFPNSANRPTICIMAGDSVQDNARLIAAAPELLESCRELKSALAAAMRVMAQYDGATEGFVALLAYLDIKDGIGVRAAAAIAKC